MPRACGRDFVWRARVGFFYVLLAAAAMPAPTVAEEAAAGQVVVTIKPIHSIVARVMQGVGTPTLIVDGAASPHTFSLKPSAAKAIASADVFIGVSQELEPFSRRLITSLPPTADAISVVGISGLKLYPRREGGVFEADTHGGDHDHEHDGHGDHGGDAMSAIDGHVWLDPGNAEVIAIAVADRLAARYPAAAAKIKANAASLVAEIKRLDIELATSLSAVRGRPFIVFHDGTQYFEKHFDVPAAGSITLSPEVQPSGKRLVEVRKRIKELGAACVFAEPTYKESQLAAVTEGTAARFGTLDAEGQMLSPGPELYFLLMRGLATQLRECLKQPTTGH